MGELVLLHPELGTITQADLERLELLDDDFVDIIMQFSHDKVQKRLCREILKLRLEKNGFLDITPEEPERA